jgi:hypothetical protein
VSELERTRGRFTGAVDDVVDLVLDMRPEKRAGLAATMLVSGWLGWRRAPMVFSIVTGVAAGWAAEQAFVIAQDIHAAALEITAAAAMRDLDAGDAIAMDKIRAAARITPDANCTV